MEECLITDEVCSNTNKKCKECKLEECGKVLNMIETQQNYEDKYKMEQLRKRLPKQCKECPHLEIIDLNNKKVKCFYNITGVCILR